jgi:hypothetical protein
MKLKIFALLALSAILLGANDDSHRGPAEAAVRTD